ncbi:MAG: hypothetical protein OXC91_07255 [Rhodobacteraceae bacterium]|nr:hypothetical protein [Paracoccaceae bacterium]
MRKFENLARAKAKRAKALERARASRPDPNELAEAVEGHPFRVTGGGAAWITEQLVILYANLPDGSRRAFLKAIVGLAGDGDEFLKLILVAIAKTLVARGFRVDSTLARFMEDNPVLFGVEESADA